MQSGKLLRKLGLGDAASRALAPLAKDRAPLPTEEEAEALLASVSPDEGGSCLFRREADFGGAAHTLDIILPVYNVEAYLPACLESVLSQKTDFSFRLIAIDDGSTDGSGAILDACKDPRLLTVHQENRGFSGARNAGLRLARAPWLFFLDSDDLLAPGALSVLMQAAEESGASMVQGGFTAVDTQGRALFRGAHPAGVLDPRRDGNGYFWGKLFRAELFSALCMPEGYWYEDSMLAQLLYPRMALEGQSVFGVDFDAVLYRVNPQGITRQSRGKPKSLDSLYITRSLHRDRLALGLKNDQAYYEYLLHMLVLTRRRTEALGEDVGRAVFALSRAFLLREFEGFSTGRGGYRVLEQAVRGGDYGAYRLFCSLH